MRCASATQALEAADEVKTRFLANMSYEFRTPLTSIGGFAELLEAGVAGDLTPQAQEYVAAILESVERLTEQVENVLDLSQSEAGLLPLAKREARPAAVRHPGRARARGSDRRSRARARPARRQRGGKVDADPRQLGARARPPARQRDRRDAQGRQDPGRPVAQATTGVRIVVSDNGAGMTPDELRRARSKACAPAPTGGPSARQGLGIPLARQLVEAHGGTLEIVSRRGEGTFATIRLP